MTLEQAIRMANEALEAGEGVSLLYYLDDYVHIGLEGAVEARDLLKSVLEAD